jgi:hypothetical protein
LLTTQASLVSSTLFADLRKPTFRTRLRSPRASWSRAAAEQSLGLGDFRDVRVQLIADAGAALLVLLVATALSIYKPRGLTKYGWRKQRDQRGPLPAVPGSSVDGTRTAAEIRQ